MKHILKQTEPQAFTDWKALANQDWQPTYDDLRGREKKAVTAALIREQGGICCYCERRLSDGDCHIEHFRPQSDLAVDPLDFSNMLCSCQDRLKKREPRHCGNLKGDWFDANLLVSPLDPGCEARFAFTHNGAIHVSKDDDQGAKQTITRLGLNLPRLRAMRAGAIDPFLDESLSAEEFTDFVSAYLRQDASGQFCEFWTAIRYLFGGSTAP